jgi:ABC-type transport system involved in cytochrome c biogenesis permease subunit
MIPASFRFRFFLLALGVALSLALPADEIGQALGRLPVLDNGRVTPLDTYARTLLKQLSGRSSVAGQPAAEWLARALFAPASTHDDPLFLVVHPDVLGVMGIPAAAEGRGRYSYSHLQAGLDRLQQAAMNALDGDEKRRDAVDQEIIRLSYGISLYLQLIDSLQFALPRPEFSVRQDSTRQVLGLLAGQSRLSYLDLALRADRLQHALDELRRRPEGERNDADRELIRLARALEQTSRRQIDSPLAILPPESPDGSWMSPGVALAAGRGSARRQEFRLLAQALAAHQAGMPDECAAYLRSFRRTLEKKFPAAFSPRRIDLETLYNRIDPFFLSQLLYGGALLLSLLALLWGRSWLGRLAFLLLLAALLLHTAGLGTRVFITGRPPVTNLYETFLFVGWTCALLGVGLERVQKRGLGTGTGALAGLVFLLVSGRYALDGDTMGMLAAVLDSNLWLTTHVITISAGYAGCVLAGIIGHIHLLGSLRRPLDKTMLDQTARALYAALAFGLLFTVTGTVMGGIWADQSWGRFWGWDPKENGALLIILWASALFHARRAGLIGHLGMAAGSIGAIVCVVLAWFGVNLLGVGLHSYGFTSGVARALLLFLGLELLFLGVVVPLAKWREES